MLDYLWFGLVALSVVCALCTGRMGALSGAVLEGAAHAVELSLALLGGMCAWLGFLRIAERAGLTDLLGEALSPVIGRLFPEFREDREIRGKLCMNLSANLLGLGNAATPLGLSAMRAMAEKHPGDAPSPDMIRFVVLNTASLQLLPVNMAALRASLGAREPFAILPQVWLTSLGCLCVCLLACRAFQRRDLR